MIGLSGIVASLCCALALTVTMPAAAQTVGLSWAGFNGERWRIDQAAIHAALTEAGVGHLDTDAGLSAEKQIADIHRLMAADVDTLIVIAENARALEPVVAEATERGIPVISYDRLIDHPRAFYVSFDSVAVGRLQAAALMEEVPVGRYAFIEGSATDPNAARILAGQREILADALASGEIINVGVVVAEAWSVESAYEGFSRVMRETGGGVDAVLASNDALAGAAIEVLEAYGMAGSVAVSGQDGTTSALNRIARGTQIMTVWKDARALGRRAGTIAARFARGESPSAIPDSILYRPGGRTLEVNAVFLPPRLITRANLDVVISAGWASKSAVCDGVDPEVVPLCAPE